MPAENVHTSQIKIKVEGSPIDQMVLNALMEATVDQNVTLPGMFTIRLFDPGLKLLEDGPFNLTKEVEIELQHPVSDVWFSLIKGEITGLEMNFDEGMNAEMVVRGYDKSHRLYRENKSVVHLNKKDSELATAFAGNAGLSPQVDTTTTVYDAIYQDNQSDLAFLMQRAWRIGFECFVEDGKLYFRKPEAEGSGPTLTWGDKLVSFYPVISLAEQVDEVQVKGWDWKKMSPIVGKQTSGNLYPLTGESKNGKQWAGAFGAGKKIFVDQPVKDQAEADILAQARLDEISGAFLSAEGQAFRSPHIAAGKMVRLEELGTRFSGSYLVTSATYIYTAEGLLTHFKVTGNRSGLLFEQMSHQEPLQKWGGVVPAVVTNTQDPEDLGRVKVKYPWMSDSAESWWARVVSPGAGKEAGFFLVPELDDEVMVAFEHGDINYPYVLGGVWNGKNAIPPSGAGAAAGEKPQVRTWTSIDGHEISMYDNADGKIEIKTKDGHLLVMDDNNQKVEVKTKGGHTLLLDDRGKKVELKTTAGDRVTMETAGVTVESKSNMTLKATGNIDMSTSGIVNIKGAMVNIN